MRAVPMLKRVLPDFAFMPYRRLRDWNKYRTTDIFVIGYPRTGNTWNKFLLGRYIQLLCRAEEPPLLNEYDILGRCKKTCLGLGFLYSYGGLDWTQLKENEILVEKYILPYVGRKIVLLTRYPLDSLVSNWIYYTRLSYKLSMDLPEFLENPLHSLTKSINYHNLWAQMRDRLEGQLLLLRYEDLRRDTAIYFRKMVEFLGLPVQEEDLLKAIEYADFSNMKKMQESGQIPGSSKNKAAIRIGNPNDPESAHVRKGEVSGYRNYMDPDLANHYEERIAVELDSWYNYARPPKADPR